MSRLLLILLALTLTTPTHAQTPTPSSLTPARRTELERCQGTPPKCPRGVKPPTAAEQRALDASKATAERVLYTPCAELLPEVRALWDKDQAGHALTYDEDMVWRVWKVACQQRPSLLGPRP